MTKPNDLQPKKKGKFEELNEGSKELNYMKNWDLALRLFLPQSWFLDKHS